jgi:hypothetical protein
MTWRAPRNFAFELPEASNVAEGAAFRHAQRSRPYPRVECALMPGADGVGPRSVHLGARAGSNVAAAAISALPVYLVAGGCSSAALNDSGHARKDAAGIGEARKGAAGPGAGPERLAGPHEP